jgi:hypothetical protein
MVSDRKEQAPAKKRFGPCKTSAMSSADFLGSSA